MCAKYQLSTIKLLKISNKLDKIISEPHAGKETTHKARLANNRTNTRQSKYPTATKTDLPPPPPNPHPHFAIYNNVIKHILKNRHWRTLDMINGFLLTTPLLQIPSNKTSIKLIKFSLESCQKTACTQ